MSRKRYLLDFEKTLSKQMNFHYTLTPDHLYIHKKKRLHKSEEIIKFSLSDDNGLNMALSNDGGETWAYKLENGNVLFHLSHAKFKFGK